MTDIKIMCGAAVYVGDQQKRCQWEATKFYLDRFHIYAHARCDYHSRDVVYYSNCITAITKEEFITAQIMNS
jgi:hypothetical protein